MKWYNNDHKNSVLYYKMDILGSIIILQCYYYGCVGNITYVIVEKQQS